MTVIRDRDDCFEDARCATAVCTADFAFADAVAVLDAFLGAHKTARGIAEAVFTAVFVFEAGFAFVAITAAVDCELAFVLNVVFADICLTAVFRVGVADHTRVALFFDLFKFTCDAIDNISGVAAADQAGLSTAFLAFAVIAFQAFAADFRHRRFAFFADQHARVIDARILCLFAGRDTGIRRRIAGVARFACFKFGKLAGFARLDVTVRAGNAIGRAQFDAFASEQFAFGRIADPAGRAGCFDGKATRFADDAG